jgi:hypothetical protein
VADPPPPEKPELTADALAVTLGVENPAIPDGYLPVKGYLSAGGKNKIRRIFLSDNFRTWLEVEEHAIRHRFDVPPNPHDSRSVIWIDRHATVVKCQAASAWEMEDDVDVWGDASPGGGPRPRRPPY